MQDNVERKEYWYKCLLCSLIFVLIIALWGCSPYRHWQEVNQDENVDKKKRDLLAPVCAKQFPMIPLIDTFFTAGKTIIQQDTSGYFGLRSQIDSLNKVSAKDPNCPQLNVDSVMAYLKKQIKPTYIYKTDTLRINKVEKDSALAYAQDQTIQSQQLQIAALQYSLNEWKDKAQHRFWLLMAIAAFAIGGIYFRFKTFFITKFTSIGRFIANIIKFR